jgi:hypothetical protein
MTDFFVLTRLRKKSICGVAHHSSRLARLASGAFYCAAHLIKIEKSTSFGRGSLLAFGDNFFSEMKCHEINSGL